jgi:hypothetical protein
MMHYSTIYGTIIYHGTVHASANEYEYIVSCTHNLFDCS